MNDYNGGFDLTRLPGLLAPDPDRLELARSRQSAVWRGEKPDRRPITATAPLTAEQEGIPDPNLKEAFYDDGLMLCSQIRLACTVSNARSDAVPSIRANLGAGVLLSCLGLEQEVFEDKMPWLRKHLSRKQLKKLTPDDIAVRGSFERGIRQIKLFREVMGDSVSIYCMDTQGPFDLAHLLTGDDLFYLLHDDGPLMHHLMNICLELNIKAHRWMKEAIGEPSGACHHGNSLYSDSIGIRICEDTSSVVGPEIMDEFVTPYTYRLAGEFGSAWAHYCGRNDYLTERLLGCPDIRGINFGHIPGKVHDHVFERDMQACLDSGTVFFGLWPRYDGETAEDFLLRMHEWAAGGCLIPDASPALTGRAPFSGLEELLDFWYGLD